MRPFLDSFQIIRARTRYGPIEINSVLDYEKIPENTENHFQILLPNFGSYVPFTKRFLDSIHLSEHCLSPQMLKNYCYGRFDFPGKNQAFISTKKPCMKCYQQVCSSEILVKILYFVINTNSLLEVGTCLKKFLDRIQHLVSK